MKSAIAVIIINPNPDRHNTSQISGKQANKSDIAPNIADMGKARNKPRTKSAKVFKNAIVNLNMTSSPYVKFSYSHSGLLLGNL